MVFHRPLHFSQTRHPPLLHCIRYMTCPSASDLELCSIHSGLNVAALCLRHATRDKMYPTLSSHLVTTADSLLSVDLRFYVFSELFFAMHAWLRDLRFPLLHITPWPFLASIPSSQREARHKLCSPAARSGEARFSPCCQVFVKIAVPDPLFLECLFYSQSRLAY